MTKREFGVMASASVAAVAATLGVQSIGGGHATLGDALRESGYSVSVSRAGDQQPQTPINFGAALDWSNYGLGGNPEAWDASFYARYGAHVNIIYGQPVRGIACKPVHPMDTPTLERIVRHESNPLGLADNHNWLADRTDIEDLKWASSAGRGCAGLAIDNLIFSAGCKSGVILDGCPPADPPPGPTKPPPPPPTPTPEPPNPPTWHYSWMARQVVCEGGQPNSVCLDVRFSPSVVSTGQERVEVAP